MTEDEWPCRDFDPTDEPRLQDQFAVYRQLRSRSPFARSAKYGQAGWAAVPECAWVVSTYDEVKKVAADDDTFSSRIRGGPTRPHAGPDPLIPIHFDPPEHRIYRAGLSRFFTHRVVASMEASVRQLANELVVDLFSDAGQVDLVAGFADRLPQLVMWRQPLLGEPAPVPGVVDWVAHFARWVRHTNDPTDVGDTAAREMLDYVSAVFEQRQQNPQQDIPTKLQDSALSPEEQVSALWFLWKAGTETPSAALAAILHLLIRDQELWRCLRDQPSLIPSAVEEFLRFIGVVHTGQRFVRRATRWNGHDISEGDFIMLLWASANRDERAFPDADRLVVDRQPNDHVAFGSGRHHCLGVHLARLELRIAIEVFVQQVQSAHLVEGFVPRWKMAGVGRRLQTLPVQLVLQSVNQ
ncbi:cytochrome P450 [Kribbella sp. NPDC004536]|uniref:cytochrome P450 n=1 Tax=Kribbella sp. NPDC004536 TaxID=3364106 RepID=UPI0036A0A185